MSRRLFHRAIPLALIAVLAAGCATAPVYNIPNAPVSSNRALNSEDVLNAIVRAGSRLEWRMRVETPGVIIGTRAHWNKVAVIEIRYSHNSYSIQHKSSTNLGYDGLKIRETYNEWIEELDRRIVLELRRL